MSEKKYDEGESPFLPKNLARLFLHPSDFFTSRLSLRKRWNVLFASLLIGIYATSERIDGQIARSENDPERLRVLLDLLGGWGRTWIILIVVGVVSSAIYYSLGGWFCKIRLRWSGAKDPDPQQARMLYIYSYLVLALPFIMFLVFSTFAFENYVSIEPLS